MSDEHNNNNNLDILLELSRLGGKMDSVHKRLDKHEEHTMNMLKKHNEAIYGNGKPGITAGLSEVQRDVRGIISREAARDIEKKAQENERKALITKVLTPALALIVVAVLYLTFGGPLPNG